MYRLLETIKPNLFIDGYWKPVKLNPLDADIKEFIKNTNIKSCNCYLSYEVGTYKPYLKHFESKSYANFPVFYINIFNRERYKNRLINPWYQENLIKHKGSFLGYDFYIPNKEDHMDSSLPPTFRIEIYTYKQRLFSRLFNIRHFKEGLLWKIDKRIFYKISVVKGDHFFSDGVWTTLTEVRREIKKVIDFIVPKILENETTITDRLVKELKQSGDLKKVSKLLRNI